LRASKDGHGRIAASPPFEASAALRHLGVTAVCEPIQATYRQMRIGALLAISDFQKFCLTAGANQFTDSRRPVPLRGVAHVTDVGRDAVDAAAPLTNGADAYGEVVWFRRPRAGVKSARRRAGDGVNKAWSPGRARSKP
jgi:hypothetical protein